jgi:hypothetical protein
MKNTTDNMLTFLDAFMCAREGRDMSEAIENQEKRGQADVVRNKRLPKKINSHTLPRDIFFRDVTKEMNYEEREAIVTRNNIEYTKEQYKRMGIEIISEHDDLFWNVILPEGWEVKSTDHTMWNELVDNKGRKRANFFYKAAFYDRDAFINFNTRFHIEVDHIADPESDYKVWKDSDYQGTVKDGDVVICSTACVQPTGDYFKDDEIKKPLYEQLEAFMKEHYPNYSDINAYWE